MRVGQCNEIDYQLFTGLSLSLAWSQMTWRRITTRLWCTQAPSKRSDVCANCICQYVQLGCSLQFVLNIWNLPVFFNKPSVSNTVLFAPVHTGRLLQDAETTIVNFPAHVCYEPRRWTSPSGSCSTSPWGCLGAGECQCCSRPFWSFIHSCD